MLYRDIFKRRRTRSSIERRCRPWDLLTLRVGLFFCTLYRLTTCYPILQGTTIPNQVFIDSRYTEQAHETAALINSPSTCWRGEIPWGIKYIVTHEWCSKKRYTLTEALYYIKDNVDLLVPTKRKTISLNTLNMIVQCTQREFLREIPYNNITIIAIQRSKIYFFDTFGGFSHTVEWNSLKSVWQIFLYILA